jgi:nicotinate phosphoribosyltransferase
METQEQPDIPLPRFSGLATDLYQLTMAAAYHAHGRNDRASFELFVRKLPPERGYFVVAGLQQALEYLHTLSFNADEIAYLRSLPVFAHVPASFWDYLKDFRFTGDIWAMPEGTLAFGNEPLVRVTAPLIEAQIVETFLLATINFQTMIASKAARMVTVAQGRSIIEFGARRCHSFGAAIYAARAAYIGGCVGTSNVEAGRMFDIPVYGTAAHSFTMSYEREIDAFRAYHAVFPETTTLLLDTYDTINAARMATEFGAKLRGVRLDSGDLVAFSKQVRAIFDEAGMQHVKIMASSDLNEYKITELLASDAPIDLFGIGTELSTSRDLPALGGVYKLVEIERNGLAQPKMKLSQEKATYPYRKQVWRQSAQGKFTNDVIALAKNDEPSGEPLLQQVMRNGELAAPLPSLAETQARARRQLAALPDKYKTLRHAPAYPVRFSERLEAQRQRLLNTLAAEVAH